MSLKEINSMTFWKLTLSTAIFFSVAYGYGQSTRMTPLQVVELLKSKQGKSVFYDNSILEKLGPSEIDANNISQETLQTYFKQYQLNVIIRGDAYYLMDGLIAMKGFPDNFYSDDLLIEEESQPQQLSLPTRQNVNPEYEVIQFGKTIQNAEKRTFTISGRVMSSGENPEPMIGTTILLENTTKGTVTDAEGRYEFALPGGQRKLKIQAIGMRPTTRTLRVYANGTLDINMQEDISSLAEVVVFGEQEDEVENMLIGVEKINVEQLSKMPLLMGEADMVKAILTLPGVQTVTEVSNGFNVRGGGVDQNLVTLDNATIINPSHFFGFFSTFHPDLIDDATLNKGGISAQYGGRLSSILNISSAKGDMTEFKGNAGISPITGRASLEGPIIKDKVSFNIGGRSTYSDWALQQVGDTRIKNSEANFYDLMGKISVNTSDRSNLDVMAYVSSDNFDFDGISAFEYSNILTSISYFQTLGAGLLHDVFVTTSQYKFNVINESNLTTASESKFQIDQYGIKNNFFLERSPKVNLTFGHQAIYYETNPGELLPFGEESALEPVSLEHERGIENALYIENEHELNDKTKLSYGVRWSSYASLGGQTIFDYAPGVPKSRETIVDTLQFNNGDLVKFYSGFEPRFVARYKLNNTSSIKLGYNRMIQYLNLLSNNITPAPTDIWKLSGYHFQPQSADQISIGYFKDFLSPEGKIFDVSAELYYKKANNVLDYKLGAELTANETIEAEVLFGNNNSYGLEIQASKNQGVLSGWLNYTFARSLNQFDGNFESEKINDGAYFPSNSDKPHSFKSVMNYDIFRRLRASMSVNYSTGRPLTLPVTAFEFGGKKRIQYGNRNESRIPDYFRLDFSATWEGNIRKDKFLHESYTLSVVNVTGRNNPYSVFFQYDEQDRLRAYTLSIFARPIVTLTVNLSFNAK